MKPEWPLYGLAAALGTVVLLAAMVLGWSEQTTTWLLGGGLALLLLFYLPRTGRPGSTRRVRSMRR